MTTVETCEVCGGGYNYMSQQYEADIRYDFTGGEPVSVSLELDNIRVGDHNDRQPGVCNRCRGRMLIQMGEELIEG